MKKYFVIILLIISTSLSAQIEVLSYFLSKPDTNIIYLNFRNTFQLKNISDNSLKIVYRKNDTIIPHNNFFEVHPYKSDSIINIKILKGNEIIYARKYKVLQAPDPTAHIGNYSDSILTKEQILAKPEINSGYSNTLITDFWYTSSYKATYYSNFGDTLGFFESDGNMLTDTQKDMIKMALPNDYIIFEVYARCPDCTTYIFRPLKIIIKE